MQIDYLLCIIISLPEHILDSLSFLCCSLLIIPEYLRYYVGCSGWRNVPWRESFYPGSINVSSYLTYYSSKFDFVEANLGGYTFSSNSGRQIQQATDYSRFFDSMVRRWSKQTPSDFHFAIRIPGDLVFAKPLATLQDKNSSLAADTVRLDEFLQTLDLVKGKVITLTLDVPSNLTLGDGRGWLESILDICGRHGFSVAIRFGSRSWFQDLTFSLLKKHGASIVWSFDIVNPYPNIVSISDGLYFRVRGDTTDGKSRDYAQERIQFSKLVDLIRQKADEEQINYAIIAVDNPDHATLLQKMLGIEKKSSTLEPSNVATVPFIAAHSDQKNNGRVIACVDLNAFYPSCEELRNPSLKGKPHAVIMTDQREGEITRGVVSSCSYDARRYAVRSAMSLSKAKSLCPDLILLPVEIPYYSLVSEKVMSVLEPFGEVLEQASIDEAFLDCTSKLNSKDDLESLREYGQRIKQAVKEKCGLLCSVGIASTKSAAKIASDYEKPDGLTVVRSAELKDFLAPLKVSRVSGIGPKTEQALKQMEIVTLGQLANSDVQNLVQRFGKNGQWMWKVANGLDSEPVTPRGDHVSISTETTLDSSTRSKGQIQALLPSLTDEIYQRVSRHGYSFRTVGLKLVRTDFSIATRETTYPEPQVERKSIESAVGPLLEKFDLSEAEQAIRKVGLKLTHLVRHDIESSKQPTRLSQQKSLLDFS